MCFSLVPVQVAALVSSRHIAPLLPPAALSQLLDISLSLLAHPSPQVFAAAQDCLALLLPTCAAAALPAPPSDDAQMQDAAAAASAAAPVAAEGAAQTGTQDGRTKAQEETRLRFTLGRLQEYTGNSVATRELTLDARKAALQVGRDVLRTG